MNQNLPVYAYKEEILMAVKENPCTIITAETGAGKSTQVPQFLLEAGYEVVVTQPRRLAARSVAERVAEEYGCKLGQEIGYRTGFERLDSRNTQCLFCTDGLQLVREITGTGKTQVLVLDEVHEWNLNIETLVAWCKMQIEKGWDVKVILMSATLEAQKLSDFFNGAPVIEVPGRLFPVEVSEDSAYNLVSNVKALVQEGRNVLVFQPGKKEIMQTVDALKDCGAIVLPLHGQLEPADQKKCFRHYNQPKVVVSTNVAQTSVTIDDIDAVVDSGTERRVELADGIEGLYLKPISQADCKQRKGRAGRVKEGKYILCSDYSLESRNAFPKAEIERTRLDQMVLRLASAGIDATELEFFHNPDHSVLVEAKRALYALGAMTKDGQMTKIGRKMAKMPLSVQFSRMLIEADKLGVVEDVLTLAAILEMGGLRAKGDKWETYVTQQDQSDLLVELDLWQVARGAKRNQLVDYGIHAKTYFRTKELRGKLSDSIRQFGLKRGSTGVREDIVKACVAGMVDHLYQEYYGSYKNGGSGTRELARESVVKSASPKWLVGLPKDIQFKNRRGYLMTLELVHMATKVDPMWLTQVAPHLVETETGLKAHYCAEDDTVKSTTKTIFNGQEVDQTVVVDTNHADASDLFLSWMAGEMVL